MIEDITHIKRKLGRLMNDYWNSRFKEGKVWGSSPSGTTRIASEYFRKYAKKNILVIGSGYGRNANYFYENGYDVEGIEYAKDGIDIARKDNPCITYYHGSVFDMPFTNKTYSAIYCYNVIHLFVLEERKALLDICSELLEEDGLLFVSAFSDEDSDFGKGEKLEMGTFESKKDKPVHYYDRDEFRGAFEKYKIIDEGNYREVVGDKSCCLRYILAQKGKILQSI